MQMNNNVIYLYDYAADVVVKAQNQKKPEWALNAKEQRALRHISSVIHNMPHAVTDEEHIEQ